MAGIERIDIITPQMGYSGGAKHFWESKRHWHCANGLYHSIFDRLGAKLNQGNRVTQCPSDDFLSGYDRALGIDVFFHFANGMVGTLQEKCLAYLPETTVTVEYMQDPRIKEYGDWFNIKTQFYFVGYDSLHTECPIKQGMVEQEIQTGICLTCGHPFDFQSWILLNWPVVILETNRGNIGWRTKDNQKYGRANFKCAAFSAFPLSCVLDKYEMDKRREWTAKELQYRSRERSSKREWKGFGNGQHGQNTLV